MAKNIRAEQKTEAIARMKKLKLLPEIISEFEKDGTLYYSEIAGILYWVSNNPEWEKFIKDFEKKHNALVYHAELSHLEFGDCLSLLYVSDTKSEWVQDRKDMDDGYVTCYVKNLDVDWCSEFGAIVVKSMNGGIRRVG